MVLIQLVQLLAKVIQPVRQHVEVIQLVHLHVEVILQELQPVVHIQAVRLPVARDLLIAQAHHLTIAQIVVPAPQVQVHRTQALLQVHLILEAVAQVVQAVRVAQVAVHVILVAALVVVEDSM